MTKAPDRSARAATLHTLAPTARTVHGHFSRELPPVLTIAPGDTVRFTTLDAGWGVVESPDPFAPAPRFPGRDRQRDPGHALCGPVAIEGARAGDTLEVRILSVRTGRWGWSSAGGFPSPVNDALGLSDPPESSLRWRLDPDAGRAESDRGHVLAMRPFLGVLGMPPEAPGWHSTIPPRPCGGNIDCRELVAGSRLFLPIAVDHALFSAGDGHALQGDGEVAGPALECPMEAVDLEFQLHRGGAPEWPRAETPAGWVTLGFDPDLDRAMLIALDQMLKLIAGRLGVDRREALMLSSMLVQLRISQIVNGTRGVHALLPTEALRALGLA
ncbi:MAG TPA: acetamidase/formamidase family protein [Candidatus Eisenbacteria bacterium]|nr:acetamidase/formamidase family protein [Candidatus Eisenbacteria bacterium]